MKERLAAGVAGLFALTASAASAATTSCSTVAACIFGSNSSFVAGIVSMFPTMLVPKLRNAAEYGSPPPSPLGALNGWIWLAAGVALGAAFGLISWHDWQINQPCI